MPSTLSQVFMSVTTPTYSPQQRHLPMINSVMNSLTPYLFGVDQIKKKKVLMAWFKSIPELTALVNKVAKDIVYKWHFETIEPTTSKNKSKDDQSSDRINPTAKDAEKSDTNSNKPNKGRNRLVRVNRFAQEVVLRKVMLSQVLDMLITGEGFGWMGTIKEAQVKSAIQSIVAKASYMEYPHSGIESKEGREYLTERIWTEIKASSEGSEGIMADGIDEDLLRPRKYRAIPSSTMEIIYDQYDIIKYRQTVAGNEELFTPKEIVHYTMEDLDGKIPGFTPVESIVVQLELLRQMWQNNLSMHKNGGAPDKLFILKDTKVSDNAYKRIEEQLQKYKLVENKHGNMLFTGDVDVKDLMTQDDMQFSEMGLYITGVIAFQWQVPRSSIPYISSGANTKDDTGGNSEKGYWRNIEYCQQIFADTMNTQLWMPKFGVRIVFDNTYIQQDVQLQTALQLKYNNVKLVDEMARSRKMQLTEQAFVRSLGMTEDEFEEYEEPQMMDEFGNPVKSTLNQQPGAGANTTQEKRNVAGAKKDEQEKRSASVGMKPTGSGKEEDYIRTLIETKSSEVIEVDIDNFIRLYNEDKAYNPHGSPRLFLRKNQIETIFIFNSSDFIYKTTVPNDNLFANKIKIMNLGSKIYVI